MGINLNFVQTVPDPVGFEALMVEYYQIMIDKIVNIGGPTYSAAALAADTMTNLDDILPPEGRMLLATKDDGTLVGCGVIR